MASRAALSRGGENADHLKDMAAQLLVMLSAHGDGQIGGRKAWDQLQQKLAQVATYVSNPGITVDALLSLLEDASGATSLRLGYDADALLRQIMVSLEEETSRALDTGMAIPRLRELLLVVADQLDMLPLRDSEHMHMVDPNSNFCDADVAGIVKCSPQLSAPNAPYAVVSIVGAQSSGKSYLLNRLFGTKFPEMNAKRGRSQTTRGIMMSRCIGPSLLVLDVEGFDGREKGHDTLFEKQAALFALIVSDIMLVNMTVYDIGREQAGGILLFKTIFKERTKLPTGLTNILVVLRMYDGETPLELLKEDVVESLEKMWKSVNEESLKFEEYIEVNVIGLPDKNSMDFQKQVTVLRSLLSESTIDRNRSAKVPASSFSVSSRIFWDKIKNNEKLDIPSHQDALARLFCRQALDNAFNCAQSHEDYKLLRAEESPRRFKDISDTLLETIINMYDHETKKYDPKVRDKERGYLVEKLRKVFIEDSHELIRKMIRNISEKFKGEYVENLKTIKETDAELNYDDRTVDSCVEEFGKSCEDLKEFDSDYLNKKCVELQKSLQSYVVHHILTIKENEIRGMKATELANETYDKKLAEVTTTLEELVEKRQLAEAEITRLKEQHLRDELENTQKMMAEQKELADKMLADKQEESEKMLAIQNEQIEKLLAAHLKRPILDFSSLIPSICNQM